MMETRFVTFRREFEDFSKAICFQTQNLQFLSTGAEEFSKINKRPTSPKSAFWLPGMTDVH